MLEIVEAKTQDYCEMSNELLLYKYFETIAEQINANRLELYRSIWANNQVCYGYGADDGESYWVHYDRLGGANNIKTFEYKHLDFDALSDGDIIQIPTVIKMHEGFFDWGAGAEILLTFNYQVERLDEDLLFLTAIPTLPYFNLRKAKPNYERLRKYMYAWKKYKKWLEMGSLADSLVELIWCYLDGMVDMATIDTALMWTLLADDDGEHILNVALTTQRSKSTNRMA